MKSEQGKPDIKNIIISRGGMVDTESHYCGKQHIS
jgi:hypothetical protein